MQRLELQINGVVQGIGFRPSVYRIAKKLKLTGWVINNGAGVRLQIQGERVNDFAELLQQYLPSVADIQSFNSKIIPVQLHETEFVIKTSQTTEIETDFVPDIAICDACIKELFNPNSRFYLYPFINCTQCGARYSITHHLPYDRLKTTMHEFIMCNECEAEYQDPSSRRYHAEPIACEKCGPAYSESFLKIAKLINDNQIVAIKALGGYQLIANALSPATVDMLRVKKQRLFKPFAVMLFNLASIRYFYHCTVAEEKLLLSAERPIVLLKFRKSFNTAIAPGLTEHGVMLPYTGMHYCLYYYYLNQPSEIDREEKVFPHCLIVTSGNLLGQALITNEAKAEQHLTKITSHVVSHNREILLPVDDSITKIIDNKPTIIRRARGYVPTRINGKDTTTGILALGCYLKNTICLTKNNAFYLSQYLGTLDNKSNIEFLDQAITHLKQLLNIEVRFIAHDQHPDIYTTQLAAFFDLPSFAIQHHHAHLASVMTEYQLDEPVIGWVLDGFGYINTEAVWGGELLLVEGAQFQQLAQLKSYSLLGGDKAAKEPWRMALSILQDLNLPQKIEELAKNNIKIATLAKLLKHDNLMLQTSSCGRYFDAASALLNICQANTYEGEAAMRLEALVTKPLVLEDGWVLRENKLDFSQLWRYLLTVDTVTGANYFHGTLAAALVETARKKCNSLRINKLILTGGCLQNKILAEIMLQQLRQFGIEVYYPRLVPCNDGGLSLGQAWVTNKLIYQN